MSIFVTWEICTSSWDLPETFSFPRSPSYAGDLSAIGSASYAEYEYSQEQN